MSLTVSLPQVEEALQRAEREAEEAGRRVLALQKIADGLRELNGHASDVLGQSALAAAVFLPAEKVTHPRGRQAVRIITSERPGLWTLTELRDQLKSRGWFTSPKAVEVAVRRLCEAGEARSTSEKGRYEFPAILKEVDRETLANGVSDAGVIGS